MESIAEGRAQETLNTTKTGELLVNHNFIVYFFLTVALCSHSRREMSGVNHWDCL